MHTAHTIYNQTGIIWINIKLMKYLNKQHQSQVSAKLIRP